MSDPKIYEDGNSQQNMETMPRDLMTDKQREKGEYYRQCYVAREAEIEGLVREWYELQRMYECIRERYTDDPKAPMSFIPLLTPNVEGQVAAMIEPEIDFVHFSDNPAHENTMSVMDAASDYNRRKNAFFRQFKDFTRGYINLGNAWITVSWEKFTGASPQQPKGYPRLEVPPLGSVFVDGRIKDYKDLQQAEYMIRKVDNVPIRWARKEYGDDIADSIQTNNATTIGDSTTRDDIDSFTLLLVWNRNNDDENLNLLEMDTNGLVCRQSPEDKPIYTYVNNEYPFWMSRMMPIQGEFYGFGDGKMLKPAQEKVNNLTDELEIACRFNAQTKIIVDRKARMGLDQLDSDPSKIAVCDNPRGNIMALPGTGINPVVQTMIEFLLREAQRMTRFSDVMTGQRQAASTTATAVNSAMVQGSVGIQDKKSDIAAAMKWADLYCLKLCMQYWKTPFWVRVADGLPRYVDMQALVKAPGARPTTGKRMLKLIKDGVDPKDILPWETLEEDGKPVMVMLDFDVDVQMGAQMAKGKNEVFNMVTTLSQLNMPDANGVVKPIISRKRAKQLYEKQVGFQLSADGESDDDIPVAPPAAASNGLNPLDPNGSVVQPQGASVNPQPDNLANQLPGMAMSGRMG